MSANSSDAMSLRLLIESPILPKEGGGTVAKYQLWWMCQIFAVFLLEGLKHCMSSPRQSRKGSVGLSSYALVAGFAADNGWGCTCFSHATQFASVSYDIQQSRTGTGTGTGNGRPSIKHIFLFQIN
jgi:hypothetical protein